MYSESINNNHLEAQWQMKWKHHPKSGRIGSLSGIALLCLFYFGEVTAFLPRRTQKTSSDHGFSFFFFTQPPLTTYLKSQFLTLPSTPLCFFLASLFQNTYGLKDNNNNNNNKICFFPLLTRTYASFIHEMTLWIDNSSWHMVGVENICHWLNGMHRLGFHFQPAYLNTIATLEF